MTSGTGTPHPSPVRGPPETGDNPPTSDPVLSGEWTPGDGHDYLRETWEVGVGDPGGLPVAGQTRSALGRLERRPPAPGGLVEGPVGSRVRAPVVGCPGWVPTRIDVHTGGGGERGVE